MGGWHAILDGDGDAHLFVLGFLAFLIHMARLVALGVNSSKW